jgi:predicted site-specific integrase-resolvase
LKEEVNILEKDSAQLISREYYTQQEVADLFRVTPNTIKNWREAGLLDYFQPPLSTRVLYPVDSVNQFKEQHKKKATIIPFRKSEAVKKAEDQEISPDRIKKEWKI